MTPYKTNIFSSFNLSPEEEEAGQILQPLQRMVLQNKLSAIAQDKLNIEFDPLNPQKFIQNEAFLAGQLSIISWLLDSSDAAVAKVNLKQQES